MRTTQKRRLLTVARDLHACAVVLERGLLELHDPAAIEHACVAELGLLHVAERLEELVADELDIDDVGDVRLEEVI